MQKISSDLLHVAPFDAAAGVPSPTIDDLTSQRQELVDQLGQILETLPHDPAAVDRCLERIETVNRSILRVASQLDTTPL